MVPSPGPPPVVLSPPLLLRNNCPPFPVGGRLRFFLHQWVTLPDAWAVQTVSAGYQIEFSSPPPLVFRETPLPRHPVRRAALLEGVRLLLEKVAVVDVPPLERGRGCYSILFLVSKKDTMDLCPMLDLKRVNLYVAKRTFKMVTLLSVLHLVLPGCFLASMDLMEAYLHVPIHPADQQYLRFTVDSRHFQLWVLPFGLSLAPRVFTKLLAPLVGILHSRGLQVFPYLDDWLIVSPAFSQALSDVDQVCHLLESCGFLINHRKSSLLPSQTLKFLGALFCMDLGMVFLSQERQLTLFRHLPWVLSQSHVSARLWLRSQGEMASTLHLLPWARLHLYPLLHHVLAHWDPASQDYDVLPPPAVVVFSTDASAVGWGVVLGASKA